jgi:hypothetical protein
MAKKEKPQLKLKFRPFSAERLRQTLKEREKTVEALRKADRIRPELMHQIVRASA